MNKLKSIAGKDKSFTILLGFALAIMILLAVTLGEKMYNIRSFSSMAFQLSEFAVLAMGMSLCMLLGGIDLSIVANANLAGIIAGFVMTGKFFPIENMSSGIVIAIAVIAALIVSALGGCVNGVLISKASVPPIVATLGTMTLYNGIGMAATSGKGVVGFPDSFLKFGSGAVASIPYVFICLTVIFIIITLLMEKTTIGKKLHFIGENHTSARFSAINNEKVIIIIYSLSGLLAGISSMMIISRVNSAKVGYGDTYLLQAILTGVLGGISPSGGKGRMYGVMLAVICLQLLQTAFTQWQFSPYSKKLIWGIMLLAVMLANMFQEKYSRRVKID